ncbi:hypothetical protein [Lysobacter sp. P5_B9]
MSEIVALFFLASATLGLGAHLNIGAFKLSTESIDSPHFATRWIYRYLIFSFCYLLALFIVAAPILVVAFKIESIRPILKSIPWWLVVALNAAPAGLIYYLNRRYLIWCDPVKIGARKSASDYWRSRAGR